MTALVWAMTQEMFSAKSITPGHDPHERPRVVVAPARQRPGAGHLVPAERRRPAPAAPTDADLGADPVIQRGDVLHCDVGITVARLNTDTQHIAYVLREGETDAPAGLKQALANANAMQDITLEELRPGRTGNEILASMLARMKAAGHRRHACTRHPIGLHGHGAGPLIGLWDYQDGVPGRGDAQVIPSCGTRSNCRRRRRSPEWGGQPVRMAQEEDAIIGADGKVRWALKRQDRLFLVK